jgi:GntR family transcriptional regulator
VLVRESIKPDSPIPIYEQIVAQVIFDVASGSLPVGELIPSVRELAIRLAVHPNTVARAFSELEDKHRVVTARRGRGMEVTAEAPELCRAERLRIVRRRIREALFEALSSSLSADEIRKLVDEELAKIHGRGK